MFLITIGIAVLLFAIDYAYVNVLSSTSPAWEMLYQAFVIMAWLFTALLFGWVLFGAFSSLAKVIDGYKHRR
jgi:hypothetical protein